MTPVPIPSPMLNDKGLVSVPWLMFFNDRPVAIQVSWDGNPDTKPDASSFINGTLMLRSDYGVIYRSFSTALATSWVYVAGVYRSVIANQPNDLFPPDSGFLFYATDYDRLYRWAGGNFERAPGELPHCYGWFDENPGTGWAICNGATVTRTKSDATTEAFTPITLTDDRYIKGGTSASGGGSAVYPAISGSTATGSADISLTTAAVQSGSGATVVTGVSDLGHVHGVGTLTNGSGIEPIHATLLPYYRL